MNNKYLIDLSFLSCFKPITSLGAFRILINVDILMWLINSYSLWIFTWFMFDLWYLELPCIILCQCLIVQSIRMDVKKITLIKENRFMKYLMPWISLRTAIHSFLSLLYLIPGVFLTMEYFFDFKTDKN